MAVITGVAGFITGIRKGSPVIGALALIMTPTGFLFALAAEDMNVLNWPRKKRGQV
jgi:hypothetical protein